jgi:ParB family transcriptional regulator, chromosome partitioning protein
MASKQKLGKGLAALIPQASTPELDKKDRRLVHIPPGNIKPNPQQPRTGFKDGAFAALRESIKSRGLLQPITVRSVKEGYELIAGERRWRAATELELKTIPAYVYRIHSKVDQLDLALTENVLRSDLDPIELATAYQRLIDEFHLTQQEIGDRFNVGRATVANIMRLLSLPQILQDRVRTEQLSAGHARALLAVKDPARQMELADQVTAEDLSVRQLETLIADGVPPQSRPRTKKSKVTADPNAPVEVSGKDIPAPWLSDLENKLRALVGTKVSIRHQGEKGKIEIEYYSEEDLTRILDVLLEAESE